MALAHGSKVERLSDDRGGHGVGNHRLSPWPHNHTHVALVAVQGRLLWLLLRESFVVSEGHGGGDPSS